MDHLSNWTEIPATNLARARAFYEQLCGVELASFSMGQNEYASFPAKSPHNTGALVCGPGYIPSEQGPLVYLDATDRLELMIERIAPAKSPSFATPRVTALASKLPPRRPALRPRPSRTR
jgi:predicted enzyme related to lactoylglutathione lyase